MAKTKNDDGHRVANSKFSKSKTTPAYRDSKMVEIPNLFGIWNLGFGIWNFEFEILDFS